MGSPAGEIYLEKIKKERKIIMEEIRNANVDMNEDKFKTEAKGYSMRQSREKIVGFELHDNPRETRGRTKKSSKRGRKHGKRRSASDHRRDANGSFRHRRNYSDSDFSDGDELISN